jgi:hypothetical protein
VPGLAENRPSVLMGDCLYVRVCEAGGALSDKEYQGFVHEIRQDEVALGFSTRFVYTEYIYSGFSLLFILTVQMTISAGIFDQISSDLYLNT